MKLRCVWKYICYYKKMALAIFSGILLAAVLGIAGVNLLTSFHQMLEADAHGNYGYWTMKLNMNQLGIETLPELFEVEKYGKQQYSYSAKNSTEKGWYMDVLECDDNSMELLNVKMYDGTMPSNENEIALSSQYMIDGVYAYKACKPGDKITITTGMRANGKEQVFGSYKEGKEEFKTLEEKEYIVSGIIDDFSETDSMGLICNGYIYKKQIDNPAFIYLKIKENNWKEEIDDIAKKLGMERTTDVFDITNYDMELSANEEDYKAVLNGELLYYMDNNLVSNSNKTFVTAVWVFLVVSYIMVMIMIINIYSAALLKRRKEYAVFRMLGMEQKDLTQMAMLEGGIFWFFGWFVGAILSVGITKAMFVIIQKLRIREMENLEMHFSLKLVLLIGVFLLLVTEVSILSAVWMDARKSVQQGLTGNRKKVSKYISFTYFPVTIALGMQNALRAKARFVFNIISFTLSIFLVFAIYLVSTNMKVTKLIDGIDEATSEFYVYANDFPDIDDYLKKMPYVEEAWSYVTSSVEKETSETIVKSEFAEEYSQQYVNISGLSPEQYEMECPSIAEKISYEEWVKMESAILVDIHTNADGKAEYILNLPDSGCFQYKERNDELVQFEAGQFNYFTRIKKEDIEITENAKKYGGNGRVTSYWIVTESVILHADCRDLF